MANEFIPTESQEQRALFEWAGYLSQDYPQLRLLYHIPNEGVRSPVGGMLAIAEGLKPGVPDICLPVANETYSSLYIELKRTKRGTVSAEQKWWIAELEAAGCRAVVCKGWLAAADEIKKYLGITDRNL